jgi:hypothetical protein
MTGQRWNGDSKMSSEWTDGVTPVERRAYPMES